MRRPTPIRRARRARRRARRWRRTIRALDALRKAVPALILAHNLHGVDIDPRCAQIAQLALWMRAQRAFQDFGIARGDRPMIKRANIVIAEPMPGEKDLLQGFLAELKEDRLEDLIRRALDIPANRKVRATKAMAESLAELVNTVWDGMKLAGEMGTLLKIERDIARAIEKGRAEWDDSLPLFRVTHYGLGGAAVRNCSRSFPARVRTSGRRPKSSCSKLWRTMSREQAFRAMRVASCLPKTRRRDLPLLTCVK